MPAGQLDLTGGSSGPNVVTPDATLTTSYQNVLSQHFELALNMGTLSVLTVTDPGPPPAQVQVMIPAPMVAGDAAASTAFLRMFDGSFHDPVLDHTGFMTTRGVAFGLGMVGHRWPVLQRSVRRPGDVT